MKHLKHLKYTLATWALLGRMEARWCGGQQWRMKLVVRQRHGQLLGERSVTRISSPSPACWSIHRGGTLIRWRRPRHASSMKAVTARRQRSRGGWDRLGLIGNATRRRQRGETTQRRPQGMGATRREHGATWTFGGETEWGGRMGMVTRKGNVQRASDRVDGTSGRE
jgi:hypothetical protein